MNHKIFFKNAFYSFFFMVLTFSIVENVVTLKEKDKTQIATKKLK